MKLPPASPNTAALGFYGALGPVVRHPYESGPVGPVERADRFEVEAPCTTGPFDIFPNAAEEEITNSAGEFFEHPGSRLKVVRGINFVHFNLFLV